MKNLIIYFSSTGNSFFAARYLTEHLDDCVAIPITKLDSNIDTGSYASIGFVFPTYFFSIPKFFAQGIKRLDLNKDSFIYGITTCNGFSGNTGHQLKMLLGSKGCELSFFRVLSMPGNYIFEYSPPAEGVINKKIIASEKKLAGIVSMINERNSGPIKKRYALISTLFFSFMYSRQHKWHEKFHVNPKCKSCGLCEMLCQFNNITADNGKPRWGNHCEYCVACIQLCPSHAIEYGNRTKKRKRYVNPRVQVKDLIQTESCKMNVFSLS